MKSLLSCAMLLVVACYAQAADKSASQREREVRVALSLADDPVVPKTPAPMKHTSAVKKAKLDWLGDEPAVVDPTVAKACPCGAGCKCEGGKCPADCPTKADAKATPVKAAQQYRVELRQECTFDQYGRKIGCQLVEYRIPIESGK